MSITKIDDTALKNENRYHVTQDDVPGKTAADMKEFMDYVPRRVIIPKINELIDEVDAKSYKNDVYSAVQTDALLKNKVDNFEFESQIELKADRSELESGLEQKADKSNIYTKDETDTKLCNKANAGDSYTKSESNALLAQKANAGDSYTKTESDALLENKANVGDSYTKAQTDEVFVKKGSSDDVYTVGAVNKLFSNAIKKGADGTAVKIEDISPILHTVNVKLSQKPETAHTLNELILDPTGLSDNCYCYKCNYTDETELIAYLDNLPADAWGTYPSDASITGYLCLYTATADDPDDNGVYIYKSDDEYRIVDYGPWGENSYTLSDWIGGTFKTYFVHHFDLETPITLTKYGLWLLLGIERIDDFSAVTLKRYGKNLFDYNSVLFSTQPTCNIVKENNGFTFTALNGNSNYFNTTNISKFGLKPNTTYTSRAIVTLTDNGSSSLSSCGTMGLSLILQTNSTFDSSGKGKIYVVNGSTNMKLGTQEVITTFTTPADMTDFKYIVTRLSDNTSVTFKDIQIQLGSTSSDYEPFITPTEYTPNADGTVNGVTSLYPTTTFMTDTDGVIIDCEYNRDINKAFAELQQAIINLGGTI